MAQHNLAWMPTLSGDTQAVLATDKVRFQGQEVACVIAESAYIAKDALELIDVDYEPLAGRHEPAAGARRRTRPLIRDEKEGQTDNHVYHWEAGDKDATDRAFAEADQVVALDTFYPRCHPAPLECCGCVADVNPATGQGDHLHDLAGAARPPHAVRDRRRACRSRRSGSSARTSAAASATRCRSTRATSSRRPRRS